MSGIDGKRVILIALVFSLTVSALLQNTNAQSQEDPVRFEDLKHLVDQYDEETGRYGNLETGSWVNFQDTIAYSRINDNEDTEAYLVSTGVSPYSPHLVFVGSEIHEDLLVEAKVNFTVQIIEVVEGNTSRQVIATFNEGARVVVEGKDTSDEDRSVIEVFGIEIDIPKSLDSSWARFFIVLIAWTLGSILLWLIFFIGLKISKKTKTVFDEEILGIVTAPFFVILLLYGLLISLSQFDMNKNLIDIIDKIYRASTVIVIAYISIKVFKRVILVYLKVISKKTDTQADDILAPFLGKVITVAIWIIAFVMFLRVFNIDVTVFVAGMGIIGLVIAFAAQDTLSNFFAGIMILLDRPFKEEDWIQLDGSNYQVKHIGLRSTRLFHSISNQIVTIPNNRISDHMFSNISEPDYFGRKTVEIGASYKHDPRRVGELLVEIVNSHPETMIDEDHQSFYRFVSFGDSALNFSVTFWVKDFNEQWRVASEIRERIYKRFEQEGIEIPFPQRVIHMAPGEQNKNVPVDEKGRSMGNMQNLGV
ncbi:MAG: mechanosensitive ion channel family protein [Thermoplasmatota archaeon]